MSRKKKIYYLSPKPAIVGWIHKLLKSPQVIQVFLLTAMAQTGTIKMQPYGIKGSTKILDCNDAHNKGEIFKC